MNPAKLGPRRGRIRNALAHGAWLAASMLGVSTACSEASKPAAMVCEVGAVLSCAGVNGCPGTSRCGGSPASWTACECVDSGAPDASAPEASKLPRLGGACQSDGECPGGATCLTTGGQGLFGGGPPVGTCVAPCDLTAGCSRFASAVCVNAKDPTAAGDAGVSGGLCFENCSLGGSGGAKCHGLAHVACAPIEGAPGVGGYCRPICSSNADCSSGACDPTRGVCVASVSADTGFGLRCAPSTDAGVSDGGAAADAAADADADSDAGAGTGVADAENAGDAPDAMGTATHACPDVCVQLDTTSAACSRRCVFGSPDECAPASGGLRRGGCLFVTPGGGIGDLGFCGELCDCSGDCIEPTFVCDAFSDANLERAFGRKGVCTPPELVIHRALPCGD
jgi:hypothetical protein